jgi:nicotinic acid phosphoribosyltransferase
MKLIMSNGKYAVKLSDSPGKVNCSDPKVIERAIEAFNYEPIPENKDALD